MMLPFFQWMQDLEISGVMRNSPWIGPGVNILHLLALTVFAGALLMVDLRLLGAGLTRQPRRCPIVGSDVPRTHRNGPLAESAARR